MSHKCNWYFKSNTSQPWEGYTGSKKGGKIQVEFHMVFCDCGCAAVFAYTDQVVYPSENYRTGLDILNDIANKNIDYLLC